MEMRDLLEDREFAMRPPRVYAPEESFAALRRLAEVFAGDSGFVLQELVEIARELCGADSAGISLEEADAEGGPRFRWVAIAGSFERYVNGTTPRFFSPCGTCLSAGRPQLYRVTQEYYDFLGVEAEPITDGMLIPWTTEGERGTIWAVAHGSPARFTPADYTLLKTLGDFAAMAIRRHAREEARVENEQNLTWASTAHELAHQINNPLQSLTNALYLAREQMARRNDPEAEGFLNMASAELAALSERVAGLLRLRSNAKRRV